VPAARAVSYLKNLQQATDQQDARRRIHYYNAAAPHAVRLRGQSSGQHSQWMDGFMDIHPIHLLIMKWISIDNSPSSNGYPWIGDF
jgi:hypothetical protein